MLTLSFIEYLADIVFAIIEGLLGLRIILKLLGANPLTPFVVWVYTTSRSLLAPFENIFPSATLTNGFTLEISSLIAILVYAFIGYVIGEAIDYLRMIKLQNTRTRDRDRENR